MPNYHSYNIVLEPLDEGGFMVTVPALPGCFSYGLTQEDAIAKAREAIELHVDALVEHNQPVPRDADIHPINTIIQVPVRASA